MEYENMQGKNSENLISLKKVDIDGNICGEFVEFTISHVYVNTGDDDVKAVYNFPIPDEAVLSGFEANIGGRVIKGLVEDKEEIEKIYKNVENDGSNLLLEELNKDNFKISIGTIMPGETVTIKISYIEELSYNDNKLKLVIPKIVPPVNNYYRHILEDDLLKYKLNLNLLVETFESTNFYCSTHELKVEEGENNLYKLTLSHEDQSLDDDMVIYLEEKEATETSGIIYENYNENNGIVYLKFFPDIDEELEEKSGNYIFLIDISSSMSGDKIKEAKTALQLCLRNLNKGDNFNIVAMGDTLHYFSNDRRVPYNDDNLKIASKWIDDLQCEDDAVIFDGIKYAFENEGKGEENTILLFTDDLADDEREILDYIDSVCKESRIFPFGIDASVNTYFINSLARITYGKAEFINRNARIEDVVLKQFNRIRGLQVTDIDIDWGNMNVERTYPRTIEYMYDGEPFSIFAKIKGNVEGVVTLRGKVGNRRFQRRIGLTKLDLEVNANLIEKVWYKKRIESLENRLSYQRGEVYDAMRRKITEISTEVGIICEDTSFILLEEIYEPVLGIVMKKFLPVKIDLNKGENKIISPSLYYNQYLDEGLFNNMDINNVEKKELLRILATQQLADGAFAKSSDEDEYTKFILTLKVILAFTSQNEDISIYKNLLVKAIKYIINKQEDLVMNSEDLILCYLALKGCISKGVIKNDKKQIITSIIEYISVKLKDKEIDITGLEEKGKELMKASNNKDVLGDIIDKAFKN